VTETVSTEQNPQTPNLHTVVAHVENKAGVLARIAGLFSRRGFNIASLAVAPSDDDRFSRVTIVVDCDAGALEQVTKQLFKLINVVDITILVSGSAVEREFVLACVACPPDRRDELTFDATGFDHLVIEESSESMIVSFSGRAERVDEFEEMLRPFGIIDIQRTGKVALKSLD